MTAVSGFAQVGVQAFAEALGHFLWQGSLIACALWFVLHSAWGRSPQRRYVAGCLALFGSALTPAVTFLWLCSVRGSSNVVDPWGAASPVRSAGVGSIVVAAWGCGFVLMMARLMRHWWWTRRLTIEASEAPSVWVQRFSRLCARLVIVKPVRLGLSTAIDSPVVVGWLRPVVLLPAAALTSLPVSYWEALLAHELGHVRRMDYAVNALQCVVQAVLFYHPAVHWMGRCIRADRELCCDDIAVAVSGDRIVYARALAQLEGLRATFSEATVASTGGDLMQRIQYIINGSRQVRDSRLSGVTPWVLSAFVAVGAAGLWACGGDGSVSISNQQEVGVRSTALGVAWLPESVQQWAPDFAEAAARHGVDASLLAVVALAESWGDPEARSTAGAVGLMQIMPATAEGIEVARQLEPAPERLSEPQYNVDLGAWYLARQLKRFGSGQGAERAVELAAIAYNGGPQVAEQYRQGQDNLSKETRAYRDLVVGLWRERNRAVSPTFAQWQVRVGG